MPRICHDLLIACYFEYPARSISKIEFATEQTVPKRMHDVALLCNDSIRASVYIRFGESFLQVQASSVSRLVDVRN